LSTSGDGEVVVYARDTPAGRKMNHEGKVVDLIIGNVKVKF